jgi:hypothetical protein
MATAFEMQVRQLHLMPETYTSSAELRTWCERNRNNFEVNNLKPFACLAFPQTSYPETPQKRPIFGDELVTSFHRGSEYVSSLQSFGTAPS